MIRRPATALGVAVIAACALCAWALDRGVSLLGALLLAAGPLVVVGLPAALMLAETLRFGDPYDRNRRE